MGKLQQILQLLQEASAPPPEVALIERLVEAPNGEALEKMLEENAALVNDQFMEALTGLVNQMDTQASGGNQEAKSLAEKINAIYKAALKYSMKKKMA